LFTNVRRYSVEKCAVCGSACLPDDPDVAVHDENNEWHVERVYCSHCFHNKCLIAYMKTPPFKGIPLPTMSQYYPFSSIVVSDGKTCPSCGGRIFHPKWKLSPSLAEARWAHEQAKARELTEVQDFFHDMGKRSAYIH
jgi:hypothetical protein